jgi:hypothetical protein
VTGSRPARISPVVPQGARRNALTANPTTSENEATTVDSKVEREAVMTNREQQLETTLRAVFEAFIVDRPISTNSAQADAVDLVYEALPDLLPTSEDIAFAEEA